MCCFEAEWGAVGVAEGIRVRFGSKIRQFPPPALPGAHQIHNAGMAVACIENLKGFRVSSSAIAEGLANTVWPARLQRLGGGPLVSLLPAGWELWLDGGHNAAAGAALARVAREWRERDGGVGDPGDPGDPDDGGAADNRPLYLLYGMLDNKDRAGFLKPLADYVRAARAVAIPGEAASLSAEQAAEGARAVHIRAAPASGMDAAVADIVASARAEGVGAARILICGSLYLAGAVLARHR